MPAPATQPTWSTDANYTNGGAGIAGTPTKVAPSGAVQAEGNVPGTPAAAQRLNWWMNLVGQWVAWIYACLTTPVEKTLRINFNQANKTGSTTAWTYPHNNYEWRSAANASELRLMLPPLPHGATILRIRVQCIPGAARATEGQRLNIALRTAGVATAGGGGTVGETNPITATYSTATDTFQEITGTPGSTLTVDSSREYILRIISGFDGSANLDRILSAVVDYMDPTPNVQ